MKQVIMILLLVMGTSLIYGQTIHNSDITDVSIYEYGVPLTSCECNFINLFDNWSKWITNYQETTFLSYDYETTLKDSTDIKHYADLLNSWDSLGRSFSGTTTYVRQNNSDTLTYKWKRIFSCHPWYEIPDEIDKNPNHLKMFKDEAESYFKTQKELFYNTVQIGDKIFAIHLKTGGQEYVHYAICRPKKNEIIFDNLFYNINEISDRLKIYY
jgi:hypothetical protein